MYSKAYSLQNKKFGLVRLVEGRAVSEEVLAETEIPAHRQSYLFMKRLSLHSTEVSPL